MKWSFSSLKQYCNCPHQYHQVKVLQKYPTKVTQQMLYGTEVHKALEDYARDVIENSGYLDNCEDIVKTYFDYDAFARDLVLSGDVWESDGYLFLSH